MRARTPVCPSAVTGGEGMEGTDQEAERGLRGAGASSRGAFSRRRFLAGTAAVGLAGLGMPAAAAPGAVAGARGGTEANGLAANPPTGTWTPKKACLFDMLPGNLALADRFKLARDVGFQGVEAPPVTDPAVAEQMRTGAANAGIRIHSVIYGGWGSPLSSPDPAVQQRGVKEIEAALRSAKAMGADDILLVPAIVNASTRYVDAYRRSQAHIRQLIPLAEDLKLQILIEEVWNKFLLSPLEYVRYIDELGSPRVQSYFDVGNVVDFAWPEDWIRTLGRRIQRVHLKDFKRDTRQFVNLGDGDVNWPEVRRAFMEVGYNGFMTTELGGGDEAYLRDVSRRVDRIIAGA
ncbi:MAG: sugar phosphate isomerase/epimerase [Chloroflexi bacterium]|nr:sugar phosphate isomerase/epimerase [Chloroflexota bacterium]